MADVRITEFTDPGCPWAYSAEPFRRRLNWLYADCVEWEVRLVVLSESPRDYEQRGFDTKKQARAFRDISRKHGMPIDTRERPRMAATIPACRAVVAARRHAPDLMRGLLRNRARARPQAGQLVGGQRYTCPSYEIVRLGDGVRIAVPGFQPFGVYDVITNLVPGLDRRDEPDSVEEVLQQEVAVVCGISHDEAREVLGRVADERHMGYDGFWALNGSG